MRPQRLRSLVLLALACAAPLLTPSVAQAAGHHKKKAPPPAGEAPPPGGATSPPDEGSGAAPSEAEMETELPPAEQASSAPTTAPVLYDKPIRNRWEVFGGGQGYLGGNPGAVTLQIEGGYAYILARHFDAEARFGVGLGGCCAHGFYFDVPATVGLRIYPTVKNDVPGMLGPQTGAKVRTLSEGKVVRGTDVYVAIDTGFELSVKSTQAASSAGLGWIFGGGLGLEYNVSPAAAAFGEVRIQLNPTGVSYTGADRGHLNAVLIAGGFRF